MRNSSVNSFIIFREHRCRLTLTFLNVAGSMHALTHAHTQLHLCAHTRVSVQPIYIYDVSDLDDTATGYAGLEPSERRPGRKKRAGAIDTEERRGESGRREKGRVKSEKECAREKIHPRNVKRSVLLIPLWVTTSVRLDCESTKNLCGRHNIYIASSRCLKGAAFAKSYFL